MTEQWLPIPGFEGYYESSDLGSIRNATTGLILKSKADKDGYRVVTLRKAGKSFTRRVHRIVASTFLSAPLEGQKLALHNDGQNDNNRADNLRWGTNADNMRDKRKHGTSRNQYTGQTHCKHGHEFSPENTSHEADGRKCRTCRSNRAQAWRERNRGKTTV